MRVIIFLVCFVLINLIVEAQNVGIGTNSPRPSAQLDISSNNKGLLIPRMTSAERKAISNPEFGLLVFDTEIGTVMFFDGIEWKAMSFNSENRIPPKQINPSIPTVFGSFGSKVAISGNYAIIGAPRYGRPGFLNIGSAFIYFKSANGWQEQARLMAQDSAATDFFGGAVAIMGDYAVVGSPGKNNGGGNAQGKIYIFKRNGTNWVQEASFVRAGNPANDLFGYAVGITISSAGTPIVAVGIPQGDGSSQDRGEVYIYTRNQTTNLWSFSQNIVAPDLFANDNFGSTISMDGDYLAIGAPLQNITSPTALTDAGSVYIYVFGGGVFTQQQKLLGQTSNAQFGFSICISGDALLVGAPWATPFTNTSAAVYYYKRSGASWTVQNSFFLFDFEGGRISIVFGISVAISGNNMLIGAAGGFEYPNGTNASYTDVIGSAYHYKLLSGGNSFTRIRSYTATDPTVTDFFGESVGLFGSSFIIGGPKINTTVIGSGGVMFGVVSQ